MMNQADSGGPGVAYYGADVQRSGAQGWGGNVAAIRPGPKPGTASLATLRNLVAPPDEREPEWTPVNQNQIADIVRYLIVHPQIRACVNTIPIELFKRGLEVTHGTQLLMPDKEWLIENKWSEAGQEAQSSAWDIGVIPAVRMKFDGIVEVPIVLPYILYTPQFVITGFGRYKWRVIRNSDGEEVPGAYVIEVFRPLPTGHLTSPMSQLLDEYYFHRAMRETLSYSVFQQAHPLFILQKRQARREATPAERVAAATGEIKSAQGVLSDTIQSHGQTEQQQFGSAVAQMFNRAGGNGRGGALTEGETRAQLRQVGQALNRSHSIEYQEDIKRTIFKVHNDFEYVAPVLPQPPTEIVNMLERFPDTIGFVAGVPRSLWKGDKPSHVRSNDLLDQQMFQRTLEWWARVINDKFFTPMSYEIYGHYESLASHVKVEDEAKTKKKKKKKKKGGRQGGPSDQDDSPPGLDQGPVLSAGPSPGAAAAVLSWVDEDGSDDDDGDDDTDELDGNDQFARGVDLNIRIRLRWTPDPMRGVSGMQSANASSVAVSIKAIEKRIDELMRSSESMDTKADGETGDSKTPVAAAIVALRRELDVLRGLVPRMTRGEKRLRKRKREDAHEASSLMLDSIVSDARTGLDSAQGAYAPYGMAEPGPGAADLAPLERARLARRNAEQEAYWSEAGGAPSATAAAVGGGGRGPSGSDSKAALEQQRHEQKLEIEQLRRETALERQQQAFQLRSEADIKKEQRNAEREIKREERRAQRDQEREERRIQAQADRDEKRAGNEEEKDRIRRERDREMMQLRDQYDRERQQRRNEMLERRDRAAREAFERKEERRQQEDDWRFNRRTEILSQRDQFAREGHEQKDDRAAEREMERQAHNLERDALREEAKARRDIDDRLTRAERAYEKARDSKTGARIDETWQALINAQAQHAQEMQELENKSDENKHQRRLDHERAKMERQYQKRVRQAEYENQVRRRDGPASAASMRQEGAAFRRRMAMLQIEHERDVGNRILELDYNRIRRQAGNNLAEIQQLEADAQQLRADIEAKFRHDMQQLDAADDAGAQEPRRDPETGSRVSSPLRATSRSPTPTRSPSRSRSRSPASDYSDESELSDDSTSSRRRKTKKRRS